MWKDSLRRWPGFLFHTKNGINQGFKRSLASVISLCSWEWLCITDEKKRLNHLAPKIPFEQRSMNTLYWMILDAKIWADQSSDDWGAVYADRTNCDRNCDAYRSLICLSFAISVAICLQIRLCICWLLSTIMVSFGRPQSLYQDNPSRCLAQWAETTRWMISMKEKSYIFKMYYLRSPNNKQLTF